MILSALLLLFALNSNEPAKLFILALLLLILLDSGLSGQSMLAYRSEQEVFGEKSKLADYLSSQPGRFRTYSPSFSLLQHLAYNAKIEQVDGVDPLYLESYAHYIQTATNIPWEGYSVTVPPTAKGIGGNSTYAPDPGQLGELNVRYIIAEYQLPIVDGLELIDEIDGTQIYQNLAELPRARIQTESQAETTISTRAEIKHLEPNQIIVRTVGPGRLVLSEIHYPGWVAQVDGRQVPIEVYEDILRSVQIPDGDHLVTFSYRPRLFFIGAGISVLALVGMVGWSAVWLFKWKSTGSIADDQ
jgi:hypothetical protein